MIVAQNRKLFNQYKVIEEFDAGMVLTGPEVKSLRAHKADINQSYAKIENSEVFLINSHISPYEKTTNIEYDPRRKRKLLLR